MHERSRGASLPGVLLAIVALALVVSWPGTARADPPGEQAAVARARSLGLARSTTWRRLVFYRSATQGRWESHVAGRDFFFAARGKESPEAELEATIAAFFVPVLAGAEDQHPICQFPARFRWLDEKLGIKAQLVDPPAQCPQLDRYVADLDAESASFVYASNFLENPVSALGHAFLRIKKRHPSGKEGVASRGSLASGIGETENDEAADHGIDYSAAADTKNPLLYVVKGLTGQFRGAFRFKSYEEMLRGYAGYEERDLWQYDLSLTQAEMDMLVLHLWELTRGRLDYYYTTENCAYQVLAVLDAAAPRLDLAEQLQTFVLPLDALKIVHESPGLVRKIIYRPSVQSLIDETLTALTPTEKKLVTRLVKDVEMTLPDRIGPRGAARVLDAAILAVDARWAAAMMDGENPRATRIRARLVERRALLGAIPASFPPREAPLDKQPHKSHGSMRVQLGTGLQGTPGGGTTGFATLGYRLVLHDLADPPDGQPELLQLQFLDTRARYDHVRRKIFLDSMTFAELLAIRPLTRFEKEPSWRVRAYGSTLHDRGAPGVFAHGLNGAFGATIATLSEHAALFLMADAHVVFSAALAGIDGSFVRAGVGPYGGLRVRLPSNTVALVTGSVSYLPAQDLKTTFDLRAVLRTELGRNVAIGFEGALQPRAAEGQLASYLYF